MQRSRRGLAPLVFRNSSSTSPTRSKSPQQRLANDSKGIRYCLKQFCTNQSVMARMIYTVTEIFMVLKTLDIQSILQAKP